jgi:hypothetical protein
LQQSAAQRHGALSVLHALASLASHSCDAVLQWSGVQQSLSPLHAAFTPLHDWHAP